MIQPWTKLGTRSLGDFRVFRLNAHRRRSPRTQSEQEFIVAETRTWVNVIALTPDQQVVLVEQYRHGSDTVELEVPGGVMDPSDTSSVGTAERELREETGYAGRDARRIGSVWANPAILNNECHTVLIEDCRCVHPVNWDEGEDLATHLVPATDLEQLVAAGRIRHSLVVAAIFHFQLWKRR